MWTTARRNQSHDDQQAVEATEPTRTYPLPCRPRPRAGAPLEERLRWFEVVTDAGLAQLTVDELLDELLDKVRELMVVDTAAVCCWIPLSSS